MKLKVKELFIGLEFKIEREVDIPGEVLLERIAKELKKQDYLILDRSIQKILFEQRYLHEKVTMFYLWDKVRNGSFEIVENNSHQILKFLFSVSISGIILSILTLIGMCWMMGYMAFPFALIFTVLTTQRVIDIKNKTNEIFNNITR